MDERKFKCKLGVVSFPACFFHEKKEQETAGKSCKSIGSACFTGLLTLARISFSACLNAYQERFTPLDDRFACFAETKCRNLVGLPIKIERTTYLTKKIAVRIFAKK